MPWLVFCHRGWTFGTFELPTEIPAASLSLLIWLRIDCAHVNLNWFLIAAWIPPSLQEEAQQLKSPLQVVLTWEKEAYEIMSKYFLIRRWTDDFSCFLIQVLSGRRKRRRRRWDGERLGKCHSEEDFYQMALLLLWALVSHTWVSSLLW